jgi:hypothetical protein
MNCQGIIDMANFFFNISKNGEKNPLKITKFSCVKNTLEFFF